MLKIPVHEAFVLDTVTLDSTIPMGRWTTPKEVAEEIRLGKRKSFRFSSHSMYSTPLKPLNVLSPVRNLMPIFRDRKYPRALA